MRLSLFCSLTLALALAGCDAAAPADATGPAALRGTDGADARVVHRVSAGGNDVCEAVGQEPGCDANFSLTARMKADGSVKGQYNDTFNGGGNGIHGTIDCLSIDPSGDGAVVGGTIDRGRTSAGVDLAGEPFLAAMRDNGTSRRDPPDQISTSVYRPGGTLPTCDVLDSDNFRLFDLTRGQVRVD